MDIKLINYQLFNGLHVSKSTSETPPGQPSPLSFLVHLISSRVTHVEYSRPLATDVRDRESRGRAVGSGMTGQPIRQSLLHAPHMSVGDESLLVRRLHVI